MSEFLDTIWRRGFRPHDTREIWEWIRDEGELPDGVYACPGKFDVATAPFSKEVFRALKSPLVRQVTVKSAVQALKTVIGELWLLWLVCNDPGPTQWVQPDDSEAKEHCEERFLKLLGKFPAVHRYYTPNRHEKTTTKIIFSHMWLRIEGANLGNAQRKSVKNQMCSEVWQAKKWKPGTLKEFAARLTQFPFNSKRYIESQPGFAEHLKVDDMAATFNEGSREVWQFACQACAKLQPYYWSHILPDGTRRAMRWDTTVRTQRETNSTDPNEIYRWEELRQTIRYECIYCGHPHYDDPVIRRRMLESGAYTTARENAPVTHRSFNWNQLAVINLNWFATEIGGVKNWLLAHHQAKTGYDKPQRDFINKVCGEDYDPEKYAHFTRLETIELLARPTKDTALEHAGIKFPHVLMSIDVQEASFWSTVEAWSVNADDFTLWAGELFTWDECRRKQEEYAILDQNVACDISHRRSEVVRACTSYGHWETISGRKYWLCWKAFQGSDQEKFIYRPKRGPQAGRSIDLPYTWPPIDGDPCSGLPAKDPRRAEFKGKYCQIFHWSNPTIKDLVIARRDGRAQETKTFIARGDWNEEYNRQMHSQKKKYDSRQYGIGKWKWEKFRDDHLLDCRCMGTVRACQLHLLGPALPKED